MSGISLANGTVSLAQSVPPTSWMEGLYQNSIHMPQQKMDSFAAARSLTAVFSPARRTTSSDVSGDGEIPGHNDEACDDGDRGEDSLLNIKQILAQIRQA
jgi:hypothetical protein